MVYSRRFIGHEIVQILVVTMWSHSRTAGLLWWTRIASGPTRIAWTPRDHHYPRYYVRNVVVPPALSSATRARPSTSSLDISPPSKCTRSGPFSNLHRLYDAGRTHVGGELMRSWNSHHHLGSWRCWFSTSPAPAPPPSSTPLPPRVTQLNGTLEQFRDTVPRQERMVERVGRAWSVRELRRKSYEDLHKLWYVLYKERNMLLTEKQLSRRKGLVFPQPQRLAKVRKGMGAIKQVLGERKREKLQHLFAFHGEDEKSTKDADDDDEPEDHDQDSTTQEVTKRKS